MMYIRYLKTHKIRNKFKKFVLLGSIRKLHSFGIFSQTHCPLPVIE